jgi:hypothetical protein
MHRSLVSNLPDASVTVSLGEIRVTEAIKTGQCDHFFLTDVHGSLGVTTSVSDRRIRRDNIGRD